MQHINLWGTLFWALLLSMWSHPKELNAELFLRSGLDSVYTSNTFLDDSKQNDLFFRPQLDLEWDFQVPMATGYSGYTELYLNHWELFFHQHELFWILNPSFGKQDRHEAYIQLSIGGHFNSATYQDVNFWAPKGEIGVAFELADWAHCNFSFIGEYRDYYNDFGATSLDIWGHSDIAFSFQSRTSIVPRLDFGYRKYLFPYSDSAQGQDMQLLVGARIAQGISQNSGVRLDYSYSNVFNENDWILQGFQDLELNFIGEDFLYSGHQILLGVRRIWQNGFQMDLELGYQTRMYKGFELMDAQGLATGVARQDKRIRAQGVIEYEYFPSQDAAYNFVFGLQYEYLRQISNDAWYDTDSHLVLLSIVFER